MSDMDYDDLKHAHEETLKSVDFLRARVADLENELAGEKRLHNIAKGFHDVAVSERKYERNRVAELEAENDRLQSDQQWQPIETAPTNQAVIVSAGDRTAEACRICYSDIDGWYWADDRDPMLAPPTHWMPMPQRMGLSSEGE